MDTREVWYLSIHPRTRESYVASRYGERYEAAKLLFETEGCWITSGARDGSGGSLHDVKSGALGFDGSRGANTPENIAAERHIGEKIRDTPELAALFQEVVAHDLGTGYHIHAAFKANLKNVLDKMQDALGKDWFDMADRNDLREVVKEEVGKAENRLRKEIHKARRMTAVGADENYPTKDIHLKRILNKLDKA